MGIPLPERRALSGRGKAPINGHVAYILWPAPVLRCGHSLSHPPLNPTEDKRIGFPAGVTGLERGACFHTRGSGGIFAEARAFVCTLGLKSTAEWREYCKSGQKPDDTPATPEKVYGDKWKGR